MVSCRSSAANQWLARRPQAISILLGKPVVEICPSGEGRGLGLFTSSPIQAFSQIVADPPLILMQPEEDLPELYRHFLNLAEDPRQAFLSLSFSANAERDALLYSRISRRGLGSTYAEDALTEMIKVANVMQTNAFNVDLRDGRGSNHRAVFSKIARINHSCAPNAHVSYHPPSDDTGTKGRMVVRALRNLGVGEEVHISYFNLLLPEAERQEKARKWGFQCRCPVCSHDLPEMAGEELRKMFQNFHSSQTEIMQSMRATLREVNSLVEFGDMLIGKALVQSAMYPTLPDLYDALGMLRAKAALLQNREDQRKEIVSHLEHAALWEAKITGAQSPHTMKRLEKLTKSAIRKGSTEKATISVDAENEYSVIWEN